METSIAGAAATPSSGTVSHFSHAAHPLDVETTNWNAAKILAAQHHIPISLLESIRDTVSCHPSPLDAERDYGADTPFHITATRLPTGRVVFRFRSRQSASVLNPDFGAHDARQLASTALQDGMPRSSSSGAIFTHPASDIAGINSSLQRGNLGNSLLRKTGNLSLKQSRSIPVLRRKPSATFGPNPFANLGTDPTTSSNTNHSVLSQHSKGAVLPIASSSKNTLLHPFRPVGIHAPLMSRTGSSPVSGTHANRYATDHIEEGDVLGAVLGLGQSDLLGTSPFDATVAHEPAFLAKTRHSRSPSNSSGGAPRSGRSAQPPELCLPELSFDSDPSQSPRVHQLREAQSFESNASDATARGEGRIDSIDEYPSDLHPFLHRAISDSASCEAKALIFDVIQCYRRPLPASASLEAGAVPLQGSLLSAPVLESSSGSANAVSHNADLISQAHSLPTTASPGDDPRFAVWAVKRGSHDGAFVISNREGRTDEDQTLTAELGSSAGSSPASTTKRRNRRSNKPFGGMPSSEKRQSGALDSSSPASEKKPGMLQKGSSRGKAMLLAASAARLVAELTSEIDLTLRSDFFYTFREFMTPLQLLELLILRFEWAISEPSLAGDEARRRIVRVRTYVVIKHWLQNHFEYDFLPNRALRQRLATWLNTIAKDERIADRPADLNIVNSLRKIVRGLKEMYSHSRVGGLLLHDSGRLTDSSASSRKTDSLSTFGSSSYDTQPSIAQTATTASSDEPGMTSSTSASSLVVEDINLDFSDDPGSHDSQITRSLPLEQTLNATNSATRSDSAEAPRSAQKAAAESVLVSHRHTLAPSSLPPPTRPSSNSAIGPAPAPLPHSSNAWSRAFVQTVGRLSKFKRVLNSRGLGLDAHQELDTETEECSDILFMKGGLDSLLQYFAVEQASRQSVSVRQPRHPRQRPLSRTEEANEDEDEGLASQASEDSTGQEETPSLGGASTNRSTPASSVDFTGLSDKHDEHEAVDSHGLGISQRGAKAIPLSDTDVLGLDVGSLQPLNSAVCPKTETEDHLHHVASEQTLRSVPCASLERLPAETTFAAQRSMIAEQHGTHKGRAASIRDSVMSNGAPRIVQIDDIDLSSDEDDFAVRKALRRLPGARDLRQANNVKDLATQIPAGRESIDSMASSMFRHPATTRQIHMGSFGLGHTRGLSADSAMFVAEQLMPPAPPMITTVQTELLDPDEALQGYELVKGFRLDDLESDDEEPGDVEAALRRLEGIIDEDRQKVKAQRVERLWQRSLARNAKKDADHEGDEQLVDQGVSSHLSLQSDVERVSSSYAGGSVADAEDEASNASAHPCDRLADEGSKSDPRSPASPKKNIRVQASFLELQDSSSASEAEETAEANRVPMPPAQPHLSQTKRSPSVKAADTLVGAIPRQSSLDKRPIGASRVIHPSVGFAPLPPVHRSFLLSYRSESVARQMCLIEAELLRSVNWDELASSRWRERRFGAEVTDWEAFYRERVRDRLEVQRQGEVYQERAIEAIVARFNLTSNWVASEVVLTQNIDERAAVIAKLIRVAWKCYLQSNFASLAQIIFGLSTPWVARLRRTWNRVGYFEMRMWRDLNSFVGPRNNFRHLRNAMLQIVEGMGSVGEGSGGTSGSSSATASESNRGCIPFFGLFVSDLMQYDAMPTFLDPSAPAKPAITTTAQDGKVRLRPAEPEAFNNLAPLPPTVQLEPLINVLKFRSIAEVIRQVAAFQNAAKNYTAMFEAEKGAYVRCLKLRCLPGELLAKLSHLNEP